MSMNQFQLTQEKGQNLYEKAIQEESSSELHDNHEMLSNLSDEKLQTQQKYTTNSESSEIQSEKILNISSTQQEKLQTQNVNTKQSQKLQNPTQTKYLCQFQQKKRYHVNQCNLGTFLKIEKQKQIIKYYPSYIFSLFIFFANSSQMKDDLNEFLKKKDDNWSTFCDFNQCINPNICEKIEEQYKNLKECNKDSEEPMKLKAKLKYFKTLCKKQGLNNSIERFESFEKGLQKIKDIENEYKKKNIQDNELLQHAEALKEYIKITQRLKDDNLKNQNQKKQIRKTIDIDKEDIEKLMENPLIKEKSQTVFNIINDQICKQDEKKWGKLQEKLIKLFQIDSNSENSLDLQSQHDSEMMENYQIISLEQRTDYSQFFNLKAIKQNSNDQEQD